MILASFNYVTPDTLEQAVALLQANPGSKLLAGGHSLLVGMRLRSNVPPLLVDLRNVANLSGIQRAANGGLQIGAMTTLVQVAEHQGVRRDYAVLLDAINSIGDAQVRNYSTVGGSLVATEPGSDLPAAALALDATFQIFGTGSTRSVPASVFFSMPVENRLTGEEVLIAIDLPAPARGSVSAYEKFRNRASRYAICGVAVNLASAGDGTLSDCRIAVTGVTPSAMRLRTVEAGLQGKRPTPDNIEAAFSNVKTDNFITDLAASAEYRAHLMHVLTERAITRALTHR